MDDKNVVPRYRSYRFVHHNQNIMDHILNENDYTVIEIHQMYFNELKLNN